MTLVSGDDLTSYSRPQHSRNFMERQAACFDMAHPLDLTKGEENVRSFFLISADDGAYRLIDENRRYSSTCFRSVPFNHEKMLNESLIAKDYLESILQESHGVRESAGEQVEKLTDKEAGFRIYRIDEENFDPTRVNGRGNMIFTSIHQLEHTVEQLEYLVGKGKLPHEFMDLAMRYKHSLIPNVAIELVPGCVYFSKFDMNDHCASDPTLRLRYFILHDWMNDEVYGTHNRILHLPVQGERNHINPYALNPDLDFKRIEEEFNEGNVLAIDNFLTDVGLTQLRNAALESTVFFDAKKGYLGAYVNDGLSSPWLMYLVRELQERLPNVLGGMPLRQAWMYKYDSDNKMKGISIHADQAAVNLNIWLTPDDANLDKTSGGLMVYNTLPPAEEIFDSKTFTDWNNVEKAGDMREFLKEKGSKTAKVPYKQNRCVLFNSALLHETDDFSFKEGYENRRINLTLLFGSEAKDGVKTTVGDGGERYLKGGLVYI